MKNQRPLKTVSQCNWLEDRGRSQTLPLNSILCDFFGVVNQLIEFTSSITRVIVTSKLVAHSMSQRSVERNFFNVLSDLPGKDILFIIVVVAALDRSVSSLSLTMVKTSSSSSSRPLLKGIPLSSPSCPSCRRVPHNSLPQSWRYQWRYRCWQKAVVSEAVTMNSQYN